MNAQRAARIALTALLALSCRPAAAPEPLAAVDRAAVGPAYPESPRGDVVDDYHGTAVADPYRWLEDPGSPETRAWIDAQNALTGGWLGEIPVREALRERLTALWDYERYGAPVKRAGRYFYTWNDGLQSQAALYVTDDLAARGDLLLDPNVFSEDGTVALRGWELSADGRYLAYGVSDGGSDWKTIRVRDVASGEDLDDAIAWVKFSNPTWSPDGEGFYYARYPTPEDPLEARNEDNQLYYHRLGDPQSADALVFEVPEEPEWSFSAQITDDDALLMISVWRSTAEENLLYVRQLSSEGPFEPLIGEWGAAWRYLGTADGRHFFSTNDGAPNDRIAAWAPGEGWSPVVPESEQALARAALIGDRLVTTYLQDASHAIRLWSLDGEAAGEVALPGIGSVSQVVGEPGAPDAFYSFSGFTTPPRVYRLDVSTGESALWRAPEVDFDPADYLTEQVFYASADGTRVPMFITRRRDVQPDGDAPTLLYGYGGFSISITPSFSPARLAWMERGGVYAVANLRGGAEYGEAWHEAGTKANKQNVFDDFIAAAEWLTGEGGWTRPELLAIQGRSNGGLLVGACLLQRPELFGAALPTVGVMDMLRYQEFTIGRAWASDYGLSSDPAMFPHLYAYSPVHNAAPAAYPATLISTADRDDRVVPAHSFKFAAALQHAQRGPAPALIRIETRAGHGGGKPTEMQIAEVADELGFLHRALGLPGGAPGGDAD